MLVDLQSLLGRSHTVPFQSSKVDIALGALSVLLVAQLLRNRFKKRAGFELPIPPGPKPLPIIGNLLDLPPKGTYEAKWWAKHKALYGPISAVKVLGTTFIIVNDVNIAVELLERRSLIYSSRPSFVMAGELYGGSTPLISYGAELRLHRREFQRFMGSGALVERFAPHEEVAARNLLLSLLQEPSRAVEALRAFSGRIILQIAYGYEVAPKGHDPLVDLADTALDIFSKACAQGAWMVDVLPFLRYLPAWLPGMGFKRTAQMWQAHMTRFLDIPFAFVRRQQESGTARPSFAAELIERGGVDEATMKWLAATVYGGGSDTSVSVLASFLLAMVLHPDVQARAQAELDSVLGRATLPTLADRSLGRLPYIDAMQKEVMRWSNALPMGMVHVCTEDDVYEGYRIPKGSAVLPNVWQMTHDPEVHRDPFAFKPERFLGPNAEPDRMLGFGFGRRICSGMELANAETFLAMSMILATFDISPGNDSEGRPVVPECEFTPGIISHPKPFPHSLRPRDAQAVALIRSTLDEHPSSMGDQDMLRELEM